MPLIQVKQMSLRDLSVDILKQIPSKFNCKNCELLLIDPVQYDCGCTRLCRECANDIQNCPVCQKPINRSNIHPDRRLQKEIRELKVNCEFCQDKCELGDFQKHIDKINGVCPKQPVDCKYTSIGCHNSIGFDYHNDAEVERAETLSNRTFSFNPKRLKREDLDMHMQTNKYEHLLLEDKWLNGAKKLDYNDDKELKGLEHHLYYSTKSEINEQYLKKFCAFEILKYKSLKADNYSIRKDTIETTEFEFEELQSDIQYGLKRKDRNSTETTEFEFGYLQSDVQYESCQEMYASLTNMSQTKIKHLLTSFFYENQRLIEENNFFI